MTRVALFTHYFLEPTHHAIREVIRSARNTEFAVFSRRFSAPDTKLRNVARCEYFATGRLSEGDLGDCQAVHSIYDGDTAFDAATLAQRSGLPLVISFHGGFDTNSKIFDDRYRDLTREIAELATVITVVSDLDRQRLRSVGITARVERVGVPIDLSNLPKPANTQPYRLVCIARLIEKKGLDLAIRALSLLPQQFKLQIVGDGPLLDDLTDLTRSLRLSERILFMGHLSLQDTLGVLNGASALLHPARVDSRGNAEGTPQSILWAQALRVPVISTPTGSIPEICAHDYSGLLVPPENPQALAEAAKRIQEEHELRCRLVQAAEDNITRHHKLEEVTQSFERVYSLATKLGTPDEARSNTLFATRWHKLLAPRESLSEAIEELGLSTGTVSFVAAGGEGVLFIGRRDSEDSPLAIKIPAYGNCPPDRHWILEHKLLKEATALSESKSGVLPSLITIHPEGRFLAREFIVGESLSRTVKYTTYDTRAQLLYCLLRMGRQLFKEFHEDTRGPFVVRDFKAQNILVPLDTPNRLRLVDLGAVLPEREIPSRSWDTSRIGTGQWLHWPPEQHLGLADLIDRRVDYFALGCTAYLLITGKQAYTNSCQSTTALMSTYTEEFSIATHNLQSQCAHLGIPGHVASFVIGCLNPDPHRRASHFPDLELDRLPCLLKQSDMFGVIASQET